MKSMIDKELAIKLGEGTFKTPLILDKPVCLGTDICEKMKSQGEVISDFMSTVSHVARMALKSENKTLKKLIFSELCEDTEREYYEKLPDECWMMPDFFRTDQSVAGKIYEIQCPGSGWGDLYLLAQCYKNKGYFVDSLYFDFPQNYARIISEITGKEKPKVFHMLDAASVPHSMRYLMAITADYISYWGIDEKVAMDNVDYVIAHSVKSLMASNFFRSYLKRCAAGELHFGISPNIIFDEKAIYALPFHRLTFDYFTDEIRNLFPFTTVIENDGFFDENGVYHPIQDLMRSEKIYYLKYGGPDTDRNWGSRAVFRLKGNNIENYLNMACDKTRKGEVWLLQEDVSKKYPVGLSLDLEKLIAKKNHIKLSAYYARNLVLGTKVMARHHFKVHGQNDTYVSIGIEK